VVAHSPTHPQKWKTFMLTRKFFNQPSTLQPYHKYHGQKVLFDSKNEVVYFTEGDIISMQVDPLALSDGWNAQTSFKLDRTPRKIARENA